MSKTIQIPNFLSLSHALAILKIKYILFSNDVCNHVIILHGKLKPIAMTWCNYNTVEYILDYISTYFFFIKESDTSWT